VVARTSRRRTSAVSTSKYTRMLSMLPYLLASPRPCAPTLPKAAEARPDTSAACGLLYAPTPSAHAGEVPPFPVAPPPPAPPPSISPALSAVNHS
jgi:hypothetical protein